KTIQTSSGVILGLHGYPFAAKTATNLLGGADHAIFAAVFVGLVSVGGFVVEPAIAIYQVAELITAVFGQAHFGPKWPFFGRFHGDWLPIVKIAHHRYLLSAVRRQFKGHFAFVVGFKIFFL